MSNPPELGTRGKAGMALSLTAMGGFVDAVGYIALFQVFTANMSGNSIHIGMYLGHGDWANLLRPFCAVASYVVGMALTRITLEAAARARIKRIASFTFAVEAVLLAIFAHATPAMHFGQITDLHSALYFSFVAMLAFAMGVQTATITHVGALTVYTTFVTGTLTKMTESLTRIFFWVYDELRQSGMSHIVRQARRQQDVRQGGMLAAVWLMYVFGATLGLLAKDRWNLRALYVPVAMLMVFIAIDRLRPIGVQEEQAQTRS
ncbi:MAG TPA: YoaK family protein [Terriglobales bacterium]|nr:YoaK family protein [Terriglobales bacterium]